MVDDVAAVGLRHVLRAGNERGEVRGTLVGQVSTGFLWGSLASSMPSPSTMVTVVDDSGHVLFRSTQAEMVSQSDPITEAAPVADALTQAKLTKLEDLSKEIRNSLAQVKFSAAASKAPRLSPVDYQRMMDPGFVQFVALDAANRGYVLATGRIALEGPAKELRENEQVRKTYLGEG